MKKALLTAILCGILLTCTSCTLNLGDSSISLPWWVMTLVVVIPSLLIAAFFVWCSVSDNAKADYVCSQCHCRFKPGWRVLYSPHIGDDYSLKCPHCGKRDFCHMAYDQE